MSGSAARRALCFAAALFGAALLGVAGAAQPEATPRATVLHVDAPEVQTIGRGAEVGVLLVNLDEEPQDNKVIEFYLDGAHLRRARTGLDGRARIRLPAELDLGAHELRAEFIGTEAYRASSAVREVTVRRARLTIETVPPLPGIAVLIDGVEQRTGPDGAIVHWTDELGPVDLEIVEPERVAIDADTRAEFERWSDSTFAAARTLDLVGDRKLQLGFSVFHRVGIAFHDARDGRNVPWERVGSVVLKAANGSYATVHDARPVWLQAGRPQRARTGLYFSPLLHSVESVTIDGTNVVNRYQQRFYTEAGGTWPVELLLYSAVFRARDAVLGFPLGEGIELEYPDGRAEVHRFGADGEVRFDQLARGLYRARVLGVRGFAPPTPVAVSREQDVSLKVLSLVDIIAGISLGLTIALGLLLYGRPALFGLRRRDRSPDPGDLVPTSSD